MRCLLTASLVVASLAGNVLGHKRDDSSPVRRRKSLGFGPAHPHAVFHTSPIQVTDGFMPAHMNDPFDVAELFMEDILGNQPSELSSYYIRSDSYTDSNTGVSHVYIRQIVHGLEVADGDININIKDGQVLSYGNSFHNGAIPVPFTQLAADSVRHPHHEYCDFLTAELEAWINEFSFQEGQIIMGEHSRSKLDELTHVHVSNCRFQNLPDELSFDFKDVMDFRPALLQFMVAATPNDVVVNDILGNFNSHMDKMIVTPTSHFAPQDSPVEFLVDQVPDAISPVRAKMAYVQVPNTEGEMHLTLVWKFEVEMQDNWYEAAVSAASPHRIISVVDWASDAPIPKPSLPPATYNVFPWGINDPVEGNRTLAKENYDPLASPVGWHAIPFANDPSLRGVRFRKNSSFYRNTTTTWGNNVFAQENWEGQNSYIDNYRPDAGKDRMFNYTYNPKFTNSSDAQAEAQSYINATVAQLFYTTNMVHDMYYRYGFDEVSGNFQQHNFGRGGLENDAIIANAQDGSGYNNANFMTPPDGQNGRMRMYLWNTAVPYRDGDLEAGIVIHELSHGLSTRLTGGPANSGCLGWGEAGGMGEGWGDFLATTIRSTETYSDYTMGAWAANREKGIRNYPYSLNYTINPSTYKTLDNPGYWGVHAVGEVWAEILWTVLQGLIKKHGYSDDLFPPKPLEDGTIPLGDFYRPAANGNSKPLLPKHGNTLMVQLVINAMKLQKCRPSFFDARNAIIQADQILTGGENFCALWQGFGERGLGPDADVKGRTDWGGGVRRDGFSVPLACQEEIQQAQADREPEEPRILASWRKVAKD